MKLDGQGVGTNHPDSRSRMLTEILIARLERQGVFRRRFRATWTHWQRILGLCATVLLLCVEAGIAQEPFEIVLRGGRVMDPESALDAIRNVGIHDQKVAAISKEPLIGREILDVSPDYARTVIRC